MKRWPYFVLCVLSSCSGYHFSEDHVGSEVTTINVPYISGDPEGVLNAELAKALNASGILSYCHDDASLILQASVISDGDDRIGYRYDRDPNSGKLRDNIVGTENRRSLAVEIRLLEPSSDTPIFGPEVIRATADYDYVDGNSIRDLVFTVDHQPQTVLNFSLGQLDSVEGGRDDTAYRVYKIVAAKITERLILEGLEKKTRPSPVDKKEPD